MLDEVIDSIERGFAENGYDGAMLEVGAALEALAEERYVQAVFIAQPFAYAGEAGKAALWLERGFEQRDPQMPYITTNGSFDRIADDPRFQGILEKMNLAMPRDLR